MLLQGFIGKNAKIRIFRSVWLHSISQGHSGSTATVCPKGRVVHQAEKWRVQSPPLLQLPEGCTHGFAVGEPLSSPIRVRGPKKDSSGVRGIEHSVSPWKSKGGCVMRCWCSSAMGSPQVDSIPNELIGQAQFPVRLCHGLLVIKYHEVPLGGQHT